MDIFEIAENSSLMLTFLFLPSGFHVDKIKFETGAVGGGLYLRFSFSPFLSFSSFFFSTKSRMVAVLIDTDSGKELVLTTLGDTTEVSKGIARSKVYAA